MSATTPSGPIQFNGSAREGLSVAFRIGDLEFLAATAHCHPMDKV